MLNPLVYQLVLFFSWWKLCDRQKVSANCIFPFSWISSGKRMLHVLEISCCFFSKKVRNNNSTYQYDKLQCGKIIYWNINVYVFFRTVFFLSKRSMDTFGILACESGCVWQGSGIMLTEGKKENRNIIVGYFRDQVGNDVFNPVNKEVYMPGPGPWWESTTWEVWENL